MEIKQYSLIVVNLDPTIGTEIKKTRPCVVISPDEMNRHLQTIVIAPITSASKAYPTRMPIKHNKTKGWVVLDQIRSIDRRRVTKNIGELNTKEILQLKAIMQETYAD
jgi:mRNA interferase MazF